MIGFTARTLALRKARTLAAERLQRLQDRRLRALLAHAVDRSPFYRAKYAGIDVARCKLADLPPTNKGELMADFDRAVTDRAIHRADLERFLDDPANEGRLFLGRYAPSHTSGSQGQPMLMVQTARLLELMFGLQMTRGSVRKTTLAEAARRLLVPARLAIVTLKRGFYPSASAFEYMPRVARRFLNILWLSQTDPDVIDRLNAFRPTVLTGYAGVLETLALEAESGRLRLAPDLIQVVNNSEVLTDRARRRIEAAFGPRVLNNYATGECPFLSNGCATDDGAHINADWAVLEVVDADYRPVPPGEPGKKVLITNLPNRVQPFVRYEIGDVVTMAARTCRCGSRLPRVERIDGRAADSFWIADGPTHRQMINSVFKNAFDYTREVREWQAIQREPNRIAIRLELLPGATLDSDHAWRSLNRQLDLYGFRELVDVSLEVVPKLEADAATGKFRRIVSLVGPPVRVDSAELMHPMGIAPRPGHAQPTPLTSSSKTQ
jgi:phenylacetate-coenzyme A ligase PaaK-like adenylate-forming protein